MAQTSWRCICFGFVGYAFAIFNITHFSQDGYEDVAHQDSVRPQPTQGEVSGTEESQAVKEETVEELEQDVEEHENKLRDIELEIEAEDAVIPRGFSQGRILRHEESTTVIASLISRTAVGARYAFRPRKNSAHKKTKSDRGVPVFSIDKMSLNGKDSFGNPVLVMTESESGGVWALPVKRKGNYTSHNSSRIANIIEKVDHARCILKSDLGAYQHGRDEGSEEAVVGRTPGLLRGTSRPTPRKLRLRILLSHRLYLKNAPVGESHANGRVEGVIDRVKSQIRALKLGHRDELQHEVHG